MDDDNNIKEDIKTTIDFPFMHAVSNAIEFIN